MIASIELTSAGLATGVAGVSVVCGLVTEDGGGVGFSFCAMAIPVRAQQRVVKTRNSLAVVETSFTAILLSVRIVFAIKTFLRQI
jgi:hypothetical protein